MLYFAIFFVALVMTMALIPPLIKVSGKLRLIDYPAERKVHETLIPRVGGIGMVLGLLLPVFLWVTLDREMASLLIGVGILFFFGVWDDRGDLDYRLKFLGQFLAALVVVIFGNVVIQVVPFFGLDPVSPWFSIPLTIIAIVAVTNSINLADGLDGLAAGSMLLTLGGIAVLAYLSDGMNILLLTLAVMGVVVGFLRYNTYPARIFMGDTGSQFIGFTVVTLLIILTQKTNTALNPAIPLLLLGVPLFDTAFVILKRLYTGKSPFVADKNHIHHQLLGLNFDHYEAVVIIYVAQAMFVGAAVLLRYESDLHVISLWMLMNAALAVSLVMAGRVRWHAHMPGVQSGMAKLARIRSNSHLRRVSVVTVLTGICLLFAGGPFLTAEVDYEFGVAAVLLAVLLFARLLIGQRFWFVSLRLLLYVSMAFVIYLLDESPVGILPVGGVLEYAYFGVLAFALVISARTRDEDAFQVTPMDFLIILIMVGLTFLPQARAGDESIIHLVLKIGIMFYALEFVLRRMKGRWNLVTVSALWALGVIVVRGLVL